jgi:hypothetical protein
MKSIKDYITLGYLLILCSISLAQKVDIKKDKILIDDKEVLSCKLDIRAQSFSIYELNTTNELIFVLFDNNGTTGYNDDNFLKIQFLTLNKSMHGDPFYWKERLIKWFLENGVFDKNGQLNPDKIDIFISKYDKEQSNPSILIVPDK